jgi:ABC-2 type transport system permease protein
MIRLLFRFTRKELAQTLREPRRRFFLFVVPVVQLVLFGYALNSEVRNVRLSAEFPPGDTLTFDIVKRALGSGWFVPADDRQPDPFQRIQRGEADVVLVAPPGGLERAMERGGAQLQLLVDAENVTRARAVERYLQAILAQVLAERAAELPPGAARSAPRLQLEPRVLFNPSLGTPIFLVPGIMSQLVALVTILLTGISLAREKELGTFEALIAAPIRTWEIILGKSIPYFLLGLVNVALILAVAVVLFHVPVRGPLVVVAGTAVLYVAATVAVGILLSTFCRNQQQATLGGLLVLFPAILLSGIFFPVHTMPAVLKAVAYVNPVTYFAELLRNVLLKGGNPGLIAKDGLALLAITVTTTTFSVRRFRASL